MTKRRWLTSITGIATNETTALPWARGDGRARWKSAARSRALAA